MSIPNFNLFNKFRFDEADKTLSHVSNYCSLNNITSSTIISDSLYYIFNIRSITKTKKRTTDAFSMHFYYNSFK